MTYWKPLVLALLVAGTAGHAQAVKQDNTQQATMLNLRGLDTASGRVKDIPVMVGHMVRFGQLEIYADTCRVPRGEPNADAFAFLRIRDIREADMRFSGWMFASSPALSSLDHPRYDVWVDSCSIS